MPHHTGLIQVTAAFHHLQRNNPLGTVLILKAALARHERYPTHCGGISVDVLCDEIRYLKRLQSSEAIAVCPLGQSTICLLGSKYVEHAAGCSQ
jgi:hypothetical protein